jgi:hypothetical protein
LPEETVSGAYQTTRLNTKRHAKLTERRENIADLLAQRLRNGVTIWTRERVSKRCYQSDREAKYQKNSLTESDVSQGKSEDNTRLRSHGKT